MQAVEHPMSSNAAPVQVSAVNLAFGRRLRSIRRTRSLSQSDFAERVGISRVTVANLESGKQNVKLEQIFTFAAALDAPVERFIPTLGETEIRHPHARVRTDHLVSTDFEFLETARAVWIGQVKSYEP